MKRFFLLITLTVLFIGANAQTTVKGELLDSVSKQGEPYATIRIYKAQNEDKPVTMDVTDSEGKFNTSFNGSGKYTISISSVGRQVVKRNFTTNGKGTIDLGKLLVVDDAQMLSGVEVVAQKPLVKMETDKMTYSVEDDVDSKSMTILDMLRKVPMVTVDGQDNITVNGSSSFKVYVDGKPNAMISSNPSQILRSMPASMVSKIEVITNPGAKYDAEGAGGILDIKMVKLNAIEANAATDINGFNGTIELRAGTTDFGGSVNVAGQQGKLSYNANVNYNHSDNGEVNVTMDRKQDDGSTMAYNLNTRNINNIAFGNVGFEYEIDSVSSVNASIGIDKFKVTNNGDPTTALSGGAYGSGYSYGYHTWGKDIKTSINGSIDYQRFFDAAKENSLTLTYQINTEPAKKDEETIFNSDNAATSLVSLTNNSTNGKENTTEHIGQADLTYRLSKRTILNMGLKYTNRRSTSDNEHYLGQVYSPETSSNYVYKNQIGAAYVELDNHWNKLGVKAGLRYEHTWQDVEYKLGNGSDFTKNYGNLVPSANVSYAVKPGQNIGFAYTMRISRPGISYLNPFIDNSEPTSITYGNSTLEVEKNHNMSIVYNLYSPKIVLNVTLRHSISNGGIEQYSFYEDNVLNTTYGNIVNKSVTGIDVFTTFLMAKNTRIVFSGGGKYDDLSSKELAQSNHGWEGNAMLSIQQTLPSKFTAGLTFITNTKSYTLQGWQSGFNIGALTIAKSMCKDRLNLSMAGVAGLSKGGKLHLDSFSRGKDFTSTMNISVPLSRISFTVRWTFGNMSKKFAEHQSKVKSDFIEAKSTNEQIGSAGNAN